MAYNLKLEIVPVSGAGGYAVERTLGDNAARFRIAWFLRRAEAEAYVEIREAGWPLGIWRITKRNEEDR